MATKKKTKKRNPQTGATHVFEDKKHQAKKPGKRKSASGNVYYESRANRSDVGKLLAPKPATAKQKAAQDKFKVNSAKARKLVETGEAKTLKQAWELVKKK